MNNEELKKKIVEILFPVLKGSRISCNEENACKQCWFPCEVDRLADRLADALIAAGIGDMREHRVLVQGANLCPIDSEFVVIPNEPPKITQLYSGEEVEKIAREREEYKHRAEVAERALQYACKSILKDRNDTEGRVRAYFEAYIDRAEKELAEEGEG